MKITNHRLSIEFHKNGAIRSIYAAPIRISLKESSPFSRPGTNIFLRKRNESYDYTPVMGPDSSSRFSYSDDFFLAEGSWQGLEYRCMLKLSAKSLNWQWSIDVKNLTDADVDLDLIWVQDVGLKPDNAGLINEYYVAQYLERRILEDPRHGPVICCRQNIRESTGHPWLMMASITGAASASTDGMQFFGKSYRETGIPEGLLSDRLRGEYAGESSVVALQEKPFTLQPGESRHIGFIALFMPDHPDATSETDLDLLDGAMSEFLTGTPSLFKGTPSLSGGTPSRFRGTPSLFTSSPLLPVDDLTESELTRFFGREWRFPETDDGRLLSFFNRDSHHIVLKVKERLADRPHGHIMQARSGLVPDEEILSTTAFMFGVFNSHLTQGNTNFNTLLSVCTSQFNQSPETGQRIFVEIKGKKYLLGIPSAFEMGLNHCRWIYKFGSHLFQVRTWTSVQLPQVNMDFKVIKGEPVTLLITHHFDPLNGWKIMPGKSTLENIALPRPDSMISSQFPEARFRIIVQDQKLKTGMESLGTGMESLGTGMESLLTGMESLWTGTESLFTIQIQNTTSFCLSILGEVTGPAKPVRIEDPDQQWITDCQMATSDWQNLKLGLRLHGGGDDIAAIRETLPWYGLNALIHYLTPYGLEQFGGAAWGTRDVSQGPVELLLTLGKYKEARQVLCTIFSNQNPDGGWPQWWMFDSYRHIRAHEAHGDIFYWCIMALASYIKVTGDLDILSETLPYYHEKGNAHAEKTPLSEHVERLIQMITGSFIPGTALVPFGGGDWNDSLQPVNKGLAERMISSWTVEMNYQAFSEYAGICEMAGDHGKARELSDICHRIRDDFNRYLVRDGVVAGYGLVDGDGGISVMLHPSDRSTGISYSILPMNRGIISGIFTREQAENHQALIEQYLKGPDGARLMDRPLKYKGGIQESFQRAESSTFFGREIGLMYVHEHIRYAEALAITGKAEAFVKALRQAIPVGYRQIVPCADIRQSNCYYSSSDIHFKSRYEADEKYDEVISGKITLRGGWRIYSSGPGIFISLVVTRLLGLRIENGFIIIDPVMPKSFDGLEVSMEFMETPVTFKYHVRDGNFSPKKIIINGKEIQFSCEDNPYREGGAKIPSEYFLEMLDKEQNVVEILI